MQPTTSTSFRRYDMNALETLFNRATFLAFVPSRYMLSIIVSNSASMSARIEPGICNVNCRGVPRVLFAAQLASGRYMRSRACPFLAWCQPYECFFENNRDKLIRYFLTQYHVRIQNASRSMPESPGIESFCGQPQYYMRQISI